MNKNNTQMEFTKEELQLLGRLLYEKFAQGKAFSTQDEQDFDSGMVIDLYQKIQSEFKDLVFHEDNLY